MADIRFDGKVAIVTGSGAGLGREHALEFARRGAKVVVNDLGADNANAVVAEIKAAGGEAIAHAGSVTDDASVTDMVKTAVDAWGRVDILVANAGFVRDRSFTKMEMPDFEAVLAVHLMGTVKPIKAVWDIMRAQNFGRIVVTTSSTGLFGNFGQANYGAAKLAVVGLMNTLKLEGHKNNVYVNAIAPLAATQMTEGLLPPDMVEQLGPAAVTPGVIYRCTDEAPTGAILAAGAGGFALTQMIETEGVYLGARPSAEEVRDNWAKITDPAGARPYPASGEQIQKLLRVVQGG